METSVVEQSRELDPLKRQQMVWEIQRRAANELVQITTLGWTNIFPSWRRDLKGFKGYNLYSYTKSVDEREDMDCRQLAGSSIPLAQQTTEIMPLAFDARGIIFLYHLCSVLPVS